MVFVDVVVYCELRDEIAAHVATALSAGVPEIRKLFDDAAVETLRYDNEIYEEAGLPPIVFRQLPTMMRILESRIGKFTGALRRLTGTIAINSEDMFERTLNTAFEKVADGSHSYTEALSEGVSDMLREGVAVFSYASGRKISQIENFLLILYYMSSMKQILWRNNTTSSFIINFTERAMKSVMHG